MNSIINFIYYYFSFPCWCLWMVYCAIYTVLKCTVLYKNNKVKFTKLVKFIGIFIILFIMLCMAIGIIHTITLCMSLFFLIGTLILPAFGNEHFVLSKITSQVNKYMTLKIKIWFDEKRKKQ